MTRSEVALVLAQSPGAGGDSPDTPIEWIIFGVIVAIIIVALASKLLRRQR